MSQTTIAATTALPECKTRITTEVGIGKRDETALRMTEYQNAEAAIARLLRGFGSESRDSVYPVDELARAQDELYKSAALEGFVIYGDDGQSYGGIYNDKPLEGYARDDHPSKRG